MNKQQIYREVVNRFDAWYPSEEDQQRDGACMYWNFIGGLIFQRHGIRAILQAGDMLWPAFEDDGVNITHFGYEWSPTDEGSIAAHILGLFPEIHVWLAIPERQEIVDFSVKYLPEAARRDGKVWVKPRPPEFLWATEAEMPEGVVYRPKIGACLWLHQRLVKDGHIKQEAVTT
jgi:hypothetical protein